MPVASPPRGQSHAGDHVPALHNSGPSPSTVYRTAPAGQLYLLDLFGELARCTLLPVNYRWRFQHVPTRQDGAPAPAVTPDVVVRVVAALMLALPGASAAELRGVLQLPGRIALARRRALFAGDEQYSEAEALLAIGQLAGHLTRLGRLAPVHGLVEWRARPAVRAIASSLAVDDATALPWLAPLDAAHDHAVRLAWLVCAFSYTAPPLVLFHRPPSLRYWRADGWLQIRWLGHPEARV